MAKGIRTPDKTKELIFGLWRRANEPGNDEGVLLPCPDETAAQRMRFMLYNTVKKARNGLEDVDSGLVEALANCSASIIGEDKKTVVIRKKLFSDAARIMMEALGGLPEANATEEALLAESQRRVLENLAKPTAEEAPAHQPNPYYKR